MKTLNIIQLLATIIFTIKLGFEVEKNVQTQTPNFTNAILLTIIILALNFKMVKMVYNKVV